MTIVHHSLINFLAQFLPRIPFGLATGNQAVKALPVTPTNCAENSVQQELGQDLAASSVGHPGADRGQHPTVHSGAAVKFPAERVRENSPKTNCENVNEH